MKSHTAGWASDSPTPAQLKEFFAQVESGRITGGNLQGFLRGGAFGLVIDGDWITFTTTGRSIKEQIERYPQAITVASYLKGESFLEERGEAGRRISVRTSAVPNSLLKRWDEQQDLLGSGESVPEPWDLVDGAIAYRYLTGKWLSRPYWLRTAKVSSDGFRVSVGFRSGGASVYFWGDFRNSYVGLAVSRNPSA